MDQLGTIKCTNLSTRNYATMLEELIKQCRLHRSEMLQLRLKRDSQTSTHRNVLCKHCVRSALSQKTTVSALDCPSGPILAKEKAFQSHSRTWWLYLLMGRASVWHLC